MARHDPARAFENFSEAGAFLVDRVCVDYTVLPWRTDAALSLGEPERAATGRARAGPLASGGRPRSNRPGVAPARADGRWRARHGAVAASGNVLRCGRGNVGTCTGADRAGRGAAPSRRAGPVPRAAVRGPGGRDPLRRHRPSGAGTGRARRERGPQTGETDLRPGVADPQRTTHHRACQQRTDQHPDRPGAVRDAEDRRVPPSPRLPEARDQRTHPAHSPPSARGSR